MAASASAATTSALSTPSALADSGRTFTTVVPKCVSLPPLPAPSPLPTRDARRPLAYCRKISRNMIFKATGESVAPTEALASGDSVTSTITADVTTETTDVTTETIGATTTETTDATTTETTDAATSETTEVTTTKTTDATTTETIAEVSTELPEIVKTIQDTWDKVEDKYAVSSLAVAGFVGLVGAAGAISAIDRLPLVPGLLEVVGIGYTGWFAYKNLVTKTNREALLAKIKSTYNEIIGSG